MNPSRLRPRGRTRRSRAICSGLSALLSVCTGVLLVLPPVADANSLSQQPSVTDISDPPDDVRFARNNDSYAPLLSGFDDVDLLSLRVSEAAGEIELGAMVAALQAPDSLARSQLVRARLEFLFLFGERAYKVSYSSTDSCTGTALSLNAGPAERYAEPFSLEWGFAACVDGSIEASTSTLRGRVPKSLILDGAGIPLRFGDSLTGFYAVAWAPVVYGTSSGSYEARALDRAPDSGAAPPFPIVMGSTGTGSIQLSSPNPVRFSNGESTAVVYQVTVDNRADEDASIQLSVEGLEDGWEARVPSLVRLGPNGHAILPAIVAIGFTHRHGETSYFQVVAEDAADSSNRARLDLGVYWPEIPQPAGHHNRLFLHSKPPPDERPDQQAVHSGRSTWMNALRTDPDPGATDGLVGDQGTAVGPNGRAFLWQFPLRPDLRLGLDFETDQAGTFTTQVKARQPLPSGSVGATLWYCDPSNDKAEESGTPGCGGGSWFRLAEGTSANYSFSYDVPVDVELPILPTPAADLVPFRGGSNLRLEVTLVNTGIQQGSGYYSFYLDPARSEVQLPLAEYHDPVEQSFAGLGSLRMTPLGSFEKGVNPGETVSFRFRLENADAEGQRVRLGVEGFNREWASWAGDTEFSLAPAESRELVLLVAAPVLAAEGERAEVFAVAEATDNPSIVALSRVRALVVEHVDLQDETESLLGAGAGSAAGVSVFASVLVLLSIVALRWRLLIS